MEKTIEYFKSLDMRYYKKPTNHTAHKNSQRISVQTSATGDGDGKKRTSHEDENAKP